MSNLYPFLFEPILQEKIWGGNKLVEAYFKKGDPAKKIGESWEISGVPGFVSIVKNGALAGRSLNELIEEYGQDLLGSAVHGKHDRFPLLIKFLDAAQDLSVQVHPNDQQAKAKHNSLGKTEMWYILDAENGATLIDGFSADTDKEAFLQELNEGKVMGLLNKVRANAKDVFFIPAGRIHTIGTGLVLAEIQQTSDITYRVYDFNRKDAEGNTRDLHLNDAVEVMDFSKCLNPKTLYSETENSFFQIVDSEKFITRGLKLNKPFSHYYDNTCSFRILIITNGTCVLMTDGKKMSLRKGDSVLVPATVQHLFFDTDELELLETSLPE